VDYRDLVDFYTICLFRFPHVVSLLINELEIEPLKLFHQFKEQISSLDVDARNRLGLSISLDDIIPFAPEDHVTHLRAMLLLDEALWRAGTDDPAGILFSGPVVLDQHMSPVFEGSAGIPRHYLFRQHGSEVRASALDAQLSALYEVQGLPAVRCPDYRGAVYREGRA
jgi:hypothetical protein